MKSIKKNLSFLALSIIVIGAMFGFASNWILEAAPADNVDGYAWSDTTGWIRFNNCPTSGDPAGCDSTEYGVVIDDTTGEFSGRAWSDVIGWVDFDSVSGCPQSPCTAKLNSNGEVTGWAKAPAFSSGAHGGWSGWISFNCSNTSGCSTSNYKTTVGQKTGNISLFSGYAWGSEVVGWIDMSGVRYVEELPPPPDVTIGATPQTIPVGSSTKLFWTSSNATSCAVEAGDAKTGWPAGSRALSQSNSPGYSVSNITSNTVYWISCYNVDNVKVRKGVMVVVGNPDFTLQKASPTTVAATSGSSSSCTTSVRAVTRPLPHPQFGMPSGQITYSASSSVSGLTYTFYPGFQSTSGQTGSTTLPTNQSVWVEVSSANPLPTTNTTITISGAIGSLTRTTTFSLCGSAVQQAPTKSDRPKTIFREL